MHFPDRHLGFNGGANGGTEEGIDLTHLGTAAQVQDQVI